MPKNSSPANSSAPKAFDVIAPGKTTPQPTARPIIVTNRPMIKDPMEPVIDRIASTPAPGETPEVASRVGRTIASAKTVMPLQKDTPSIAEPNSTMASQPVAAENTSHQPAVSTITSETPKEPTNTEAAAARTQQAASATRDSVPGAVDSIAEEHMDAGGGADGPQPGDVAAAEKAATDKAAEAERAAQEKVIASGQYYLPIADKKHRGVQRALLVLLLVLLLTLVWLDVALDAGIVCVHGLQPITHFFTRA